MKSQLRKLYYAFPPGARLLVRRLIFWPYDLWLGWRSSAELAPPKRLIYTGGGDFLETGKRLVKLLIEYTHLSADSQVLDIGSGIGRMALPLIPVLKDSGSYEGFDVVRQGVDWCRDHISASHPNFRFRHVALANDLYASTGDDAAHFQFPYANDQFHLAIAISVFTHMLPNEVAQYLRQTHRVLRRDAQCCFTFFVFDADMKGDLQKRSDFAFPHDHGHYLLMDKSVRSANVAYERVFLHELFAKSGFELLHEFPGSWKGRSDVETKDFQDVIILGKKDG